jgi:integrase
MADQEQKVTRLLPARAEKAKALIIGLEADPKKDVYWKSPNVAGLYLRVTKAGAKNWQVRYSIKVGDIWKDRKTTIGKFKAAEGGAGLTVNQAEREADQIKVNARKGGDPVGEKEREAKQKAEQQRLEEMETSKRVTMRELFNRWQAHALLPNAKGEGGHKDSGESATWWIESKILSKYADLDAKEFSRAEFFKVIEPMLRKGNNRSANVLLSLAKQMMAFAVVRDIVENNPLGGLTKKEVGGDDTERDRILCEREDPDTHEVIPDELAELFKKLPESGLAEPSQIALHICLATCCRIGELLKAKWADVDLAAGVWRIPEENSKNGKPHLINLSDYATEYLLRLHGFSGGGEWFYPARNGLQHIDPKAVSKQVADRQRVGGQKFKGRSKSHDALLLPGGRWTPHDLRRTSATIMAEQGVMGAIAERCLNHVEPNRMARIYNRHSPRAQMKEAWALLGRELQRLSGVESLPLADAWKSGKVVAIGGANLAKRA